MRYISNSPDERSAMLKEIGCETIEDLFREIPPALRSDGNLGVGNAMSEPELINFFSGLADRNAAGYLSFLGAGAYSHHIPVVTDFIVSRPEFFTAYTPYQPELSQGTLQYIFEFQTLICRLTAMDVANASMYDGSTALAEAVLMAQRITKKKGFIIADSVHPQYREVVSSYTRNLDLIIDLVPHTQKGSVDLDAIPVNQDTAAVVVQNPNFFGCIEDIKEIAEMAGKIGTLLIVVVPEPISLGILNPPGACGADIVVGEGQPLGIPLNFGGPYLGFLATREKYVRQMPGRLVGEAKDHQGRRGFVLTLSTREQHIRREKATSNICTNQGLCALIATIYLAIMGRRGLQEVARQNVRKSRYAAEKMFQINGLEPAFSGSFFNEFVVRFSHPVADISNKLLEKKMIAGLPLECHYPDLKDHLLICVTETKDRAAIDALVAALAEIVQGTTNV